MHNRARGRAIALTIIGAAAAALAWGLRRAGRLGAEPGASAADRGLEEYICDCGQAFRVVGVDRHRVYWAEGASIDEPLLSESCPNCERPLPA